MPLPALKTDALPLRFLDLLIHQEVQAVALYGRGVPINVPAPERCALHKLLVSRLRIATTGSQTKAGKDLRQSGELIAALAKRRPYEIKDLCAELTGRGPKWRQLANGAATLLDPPARQSLEQLVAEPPLPPAPLYDLPPSFPVQARHRLGYAHFRAPSHRE